MNVRYIVLSAALLFGFVSTSIFAYSLYTRETNTTPISPSGSERTVDILNRQAPDSSKPIEITEPYRDSQSNTSFQQQNEASKPSQLKPAQAISQHIQNTSPYRQYINESGSVVASIPLQTQSLITVLTQFATTTNASNKEDVEALRTQAHRYLDAARAIEGISDVPQIFTDAHQNLYTTYRAIGSTLNVLASTTSNDRDIQQSVITLNQAMLGNAQAVVAIGTIMKQERIELAPTEPGYIFFLIAG